MPIRKLILELLNKHKPKVSRGIREPVTFKLIKEIIGDKIKIDDTLINSIQGLYIDL